jgi:hypothetical protein
MAGGEAVNPEHERWRKDAFKAAEGGVGTLRAFYEKLTPAQRDFLKPHVPNLRSAAQEADEQAEERGRNQERDLAEAREQKAPFAVSEAPRSSESGQATNWDQVEADMLAKIAGATDPQYCAVRGPFLRDHAELLACMQNEDPNRWAAIQFEVGERERALRGATAMAK